VPHLVYKSIRGGLVWRVVGAGKHIASLPERSVCLGDLDALAPKLNWRGNYRKVAELLARDGRLLETWAVKEAADLLWALTSLHMFEYLVIESHWSTQRYGRHLGSILHRLLSRPRGAERERAR
jgi:hypothetical protein